MANTRARLPKLNSLPKMVRWYGPTALLQTGLRDLTARIFGQYADQRVMQAAVDDVGEDVLTSRYDYSDLTAKDPRQCLVPANDGAIWVDYVADLGDGFDSTYAVASLLAKNELTLDGHDEPLLAGQILVMGGDECYPYASVTEYQRRLIDVYGYTTHHAPDDDEPKRKLFLVPGNHDWYDGLSAFDQLFCQRRDGLSQGLKLGPWQSEQHRSYFAIKLPHDWWIWGLDIQLTKNLDVGQIKYFHSITQQLPEQADKAKIIVCIATPSWHYGDQSGSVDIYTRNLLRILNLAFEKAKVCTVIAGDWHHYTRYFNAEQRFNLFTAGGGGAYLAPTHVLKSKLNVPWEVETEAGERQEIDLGFVLNGPASTSDEDAADKSSSRPEAVYPPRSKSHSLNWRVPFQFPIYNAAFWLTLGVFYWLLSWMYSSAIITVPIATPVQQPAATSAKPGGKNIEPSQTAGPMIAEPEPSDDASVDASTPVNSPTRRVRDFLFPEGDDSELWAVGSVSHRIDYVLRAGYSRIGLVTLSLFVFALLYFFFAGAEHRGVRIAQTFVCWLLHIGAIVALYEPISYTGVQAGEYVVGLLSGATTPGNANRQSLLTALKFAIEISTFFVLMVVIGGLVAGIISGILLFIGSRRYRGHADRAFSSMRITGYKNFLRMKVEPKRLTIFPIGLTRVPRRQQWRHATSGEIANGELAGFVPTTPLKPHLIEGPIVIRPDEVRDL